MPDAPLADPGVRNYRTGLLRNARRWNHDLHWDWLDGPNHAGLGWLWRANFGEGFSVTRSAGSLPKLPAAERPGGSHPCHHGW
jgi:hypothetical protein